ncbi:MAG: hypothetical protein HY901_30580, partial [Deltaproteobacteria bacterium]|nr:hypothetical protein [Deltaproteobacteria bacterium]
MERALAHRGRDGSAVRSQGSVTMGLVRLAVTAPEEPVQVFSGAGGEIIAVANAEIYNHRDLRRELRSRGRAVPSAVDSAILPELYDAFGADGFARLRGPFALALYDRRKNTLLLARDRFGKKPLFWAQTPEGLYFASEAKALLATGVLELRPRASACARFLLRGRFEEDDYLLQGIHPVMPGQCCSFTSDRGAWAVGLHRFAPDAPSEGAPPDADALAG